MAIFRRPDAALSTSGFRALLLCRDANQEERASRFIVCCRRFALALMAAVILLWPAYLNGGPFWFPDTSTYIRSADAATVSLTGGTSEWSDRLKIGDGGPAATASSSALISEERAQLMPTRPVLSGRSIYYGFLIYLPMRFLGPWAAIFIQSLLTVSVILYCASVMLRGSIGPRPVATIAALGILLILTPLPYYTSMLMPDVYSGLIILTLCTLIVFWDRLAGVERMGLIAISGVMASFHNTNLMLTLFLGGAGAIVYFRRPVVWRPVLVALPVLAIGIVAGLAFSIGVAHSLRQQPISPPFLSARMTAFGPGTEFLRSECARDRDAWALCLDRQKLPLESDSFLWSEEPKTGVFQLASKERQRRLSREDMRFFFAVAGHDPWGVLRNSAMSTFKEIASFDMVNFNYPRAKIDELFDKYPPRIAQGIASSRAARGTMPTSFVVGTSIATTIVSLVILAWFFFHAARGRVLICAEYVNFSSLIFLGVLANAAICGALSGPHARYQMRLIWLLPFVAAIVAEAAARLTKQSSNGAKPLVGSEQ